MGLREVSGFLKVIIIFLVILEGKCISIFILISIYFYVFRKCRFFYGYYYLR